MKVLYDENFEGNSHAFEYCETRMLKFKEIPISTNKSYEASYLKYISFFVEKMAHYPMVVDGENEENDETVLGTDVSLVLETGVSDQGTVYVTQHNVEAYFVLVVAVSATGTNCTVRKIISALNWFLRKVENHVSTKPIEYSQLIVQCMNEQQVNHMRHSNAVNAAVDPHNGLKDIYSDDEVASIVDTMFKFNKDSLHLLFAYNWGKNAGVRGASSRAMCLCDLNISTGFGPDRKGPNNCTLLLVHRAGPAHKDRHRIPRQVGSQRHRDYRQCAVFSTGALLIMRLRDLEDGISFLRPNGKSERAQWWDIPLNYYETYSEESSAMRQVLTAAGVLVQHGGKLTHHRSQMVQTAGSRGLQPWQVSTFTKHILDKYHSAYLPEVEEESMKVMSGFRKGETRYVPTEHVRFPGTHQDYIDNCMKYLIPHYSRYVTEQQSEYGDKTVAATKLLYHVIPHLVETVLQCGYWFIHDYPLHPLAAVLKDIPGYLSDSYACKQDVAIQRSTRTDDLVASMNRDVATALSSVREEVHSLGTQVGRYQGTLQHQERMFQQECRVLRATLQKVVNRQDTILEVIQQQNHQLLEMLRQMQHDRPHVAAATAATPQQPTVAALGDEAGADAAFDDDYNDAPVVVAPVEVDTTTAATAAGVRFSRLAVKLGRDGANVLLHSNTPRTPEMSDKFPKSWVKLVQEWRRCDLQSFHSSKTSRWESWQIQRYSKRLRAMQQLRKRMSRNGMVDELGIASDLDLERELGQLTLPNHIIFLCRGDTSIARRNRATVAPSP